MGIVFVVLLVIAVVVIVVSMILLLHLKQYYDFCQEKKIMVFNRKSMGTYISFTFFRKRWAV